MTVPHQVQSVGDVSSSGYLVKWLGMQEQESPLTRVGSRGVTPDGVLLELFDLSDVSVTAHNLISLQSQCSTRQTAQHWFVTESDQSTEVASYIDRLHLASILSPAPVPVPAYRSTTKDDKDSCDSSVSSGSY